MAASASEREKSIAIAIIGLVVVVIIILFAGSRGNTLFPGFNYSPPNVNNTPTTPQAQQYTNPIWPAPLGNGSSTMSPANLANMPVWPGDLPAGLGYDPYGVNPSSGGGGCGCN